MKSSKIKLLLSAVPRGLMLMIKSKALNLLHGALLAFAVGFSAPAWAVAVEFDITGTASGVLNGTAFADDAFVIKMVGDNSTVQSGPPVAPASVIDPLSSASVTLGGLGASVISIPTRFGINPPVNAVFFSRSSNLGPGLDLFDFHLSTAAIAEFNFQAGYGPVTGTGVFALNQFQDVPTSNGPLSLNSSSDVSFSSTSFATPLPPAWTMMLIGLAGFGFIAYRRQSKSALMAA
jgi:hypothetical protein